METQPVQLPISVFSGVKDSRPIGLRPTWAQLFPLLTSHTEQHSKDGGLWSPAEYRPGYPRGLHSGLVGVSLLSLDFDRLSAEGEDAVLRALELLKKTGRALAYHTTWKHSAEQTRLRLVLPLSRQVSVEEFTAIRAAFLAAQSLTEHVDAATSDASRIFYWPQCPFGASRAAGGSLTGTFLDVEELLRGATLTRVRLPSPPRQAALPEEFTGQVDVSEAVRALRSIRRVRSRELALKALRGEVLAEEGARDAALNALASVLATKLPLTFPYAAVESIVRESVVKTGSLSPEEELAKFEDKFRRARVRKASRASDDTLRRKELEAKAAEWSLALALARARRGS